MWQAHIMWLASKPPGQSKKKRTSQHYEAKRSSKHDIFNGERCFLMDKTIKKQVLQLMCECNCFMAYAKNDAISKMAWIPPGHGVCCLGDGMEFWICCHDFLPPSSESTNLNFEILDFVMGLLK